MRKMNALNIVTGLVKSSVKTSKLLQCGVIRRMRRRKKRSQNNVTHLSNVYD